MLIFKWAKKYGVGQQLILAVLALLTLYPLFFMVMTSFKSNPQFFTQFWSPTLPLHFENYSRVLPRATQLIVNSLGYSLPTLALVLALAILTGYAFARYTFVGREALFLTLLSLLMLPGVLTLIPLFVQMRNIGWLNSWQGIVLPWTSFEMVFAVFVMRSFFETLPKEIFEAARLDGAGELTQLLTIALPLALPALGAIAILDFIFTWNDIIWPLVALFDRELLPVAPGVLGFQGQYRTEYGPLFAAYTFTSIPLALIFVLFTRKFLRGLAGGLSA